MTSKASDKPKAGTTKKRTSGKDSAELRRKLKQRKRIRVTKPKGAQVTK